MVKLEREAVTDDFLRLHIATYGPNSDVPLAQRRVVVVVRLSVM
jgi:hypothetical protein